MLQGSFCANRCRYVSVLHNEQKLRTAVGGFETCACFGLLCGSCRHFKFYAPLNVERFILSIDTVTPSPSGHLSPTVCQHMASYNPLNSNQNMPVSSPYGSGDPYYTASTGYVQSPPAKKATSKWIKIGIPIAVLAIIAAAVVGGVIGSRRRSSSSTSTSNSPQDPAAAASSAASVKAAIGRYATATNSKYMVPLYPSTVRSICTTYFHLHQQISARLTQLLSPLQLLFLLIPNWRGQPTHSSPVILALLPFGPTDPVFLLRLTSGMHFPTLLRATLTSRVGATPSLPMPRLTMACRLLPISWTVPLAFSTMLEKSR